MQPIANEAHKRELDALLLALPGVTAGKMFGYPAYYADRKMFACVYGDGVAVKVPEGIGRALARAEHVEPFRPMGRPPMRGWLQINRQRSGDYALDLDIFRAAAAFVRETGRNNPKSGR